MDVMRRLAVGGVVAGGTLEDAPAGAAAGGRGGWGVGVGFVRGIGGGGGVVERLGPGRREVVAGDEGEADGHGDEAGQEPGAEAAGGGVEGGWQQVAEG